MRSHLLATLAVVSAAVAASVIPLVPTPAAALVRTSAPTDVDGDTIPDSIERVVCGSATCATGTEDTDGDGVPDVVEDSGEL